MWRSARLNISAKSSKRTATRRNSKQRCGDATSCRNALMARVNISDASGDVVPTRHQQCRYSYVCLGRPEQPGRPTADGPPFSITAKDTGDELITHDQTVFGTVTGVSFENGNAILRMGDMPVPYPTSKVSNRKWAVSNFAIVEIRSQASKTIN